MGSPPVVEKSFQPRTGHRNAVKSEYILINRFLSNTIPDSPPHTPGVLKSGMAPHLQAVNSSASFSATTPSFRAPHSAALSILSGSAQPTRGRQRWHQIRHALVLHRQRLPIHFRQGRAAQDVQ